MKLGKSLAAQGKIVAGLPLDDLSVAPEAAWSLRKLSSAYTGPALIANSTSGYTATVYFDANGEVSLNSATNMGSYGYPTLKDWAWNEGDGNLWVSTWYDQSGGTARNATQSTAGEMPILTEAGVLVKQGLKFNDDYLQVAGYAFPSSPDACSILAVAYTNPIGVYGIISNLDNNEYNDGVELISVSTDWSWRVKNTDLEDNAINISTKKLQLAIATYDKSVTFQRLQVNGVSTSQSCNEDLDYSLTDRFRIGGRADNAGTDNQLKGHIAEGMLWESALSDADMNKLQNNIFIYYSIPKGSVGG